MGRLGGSSPSSCFVWAGVSMGVGVCAALDASSILFVASSIALCAASMARASRSTRARSGMGPHGEGRRSPLTEINKT